MKKRTLPQRIIYSTAKTCVHIILKLFFHFTVQGRDNLPPGIHGILAVNHASYLDPMIAGIALKRPIFYMARRSLSKSRLGWMFLDALNVIPLQRNTADLKAIKTALKVLKNNEILTIFPEGTRTTDGNLQPPKHGFAQLASQVKCPIIPLYIDGSFDAYPKGARFPKPCTITAVIGKPLIFDWDKDFKDTVSKKEMYETIASRTMAAIAALKDMLISCGK